LWEPRLLPALYSLQIIFLNFLDFKTASTIDTSVVHSKLDYYNSLFLNLDSTQIQCLLLIQNSLARAVTRTPRHHHITPVLKSLHWLKIPVCIHFKVLSLTYNSLQSPQPTYLHKLFTIQPTLSTRSSSCLTLSRPLVSSHVLQLNHIHLCTTSLEWPTTLTPHHFFTSTIVIANHKTSSPLSITPSLPPKMSSLQTLLLWPIWSFTLPIWTTPTLTATLALCKRTWVSLDHPLGKPTLAGALDF